MATRPSRRLAAPFVATLAVSACARTAEQQPEPPLPIETAEPVTTQTAPPTPPIETPLPTATPSSSADSEQPAGELTYDGFGSCYRLENGKKKYVPKCPESVLPAAPAGELVYQYGGYCHSAPSGKVVRCPPGGPTGIVPTKTSIGDVSLMLGPMECRKGHTMHCPPGAFCNPPPPSPTPCPPELLPKLAPNVKPTGQQGPSCTYGSVKVACP